VTLMLSLIVVIVILFALLRDRGEQR
jgi:hypothetical protein